MITLEQKLAILDSELESIRERYLEDARRMKAYSFNIRDIMYTFENNLDASTNMRRDDLDLREEQIAEQRAKNINTLAEISFI